jgi:hypothetical protein
MMPFEQEAADVLIQPGVDRPGIDPKKARRSVSRADAVG